MVKDYTYSNQLHSYTGPINIYKPVSFPPSACIRFVWPRLVHDAQKNKLGDSKTFPKISDSKSPPSSKIKDPTCILFPSCDQKGKSMHCVQGQLSREGCAEVNLRLRGTEGRIVQQGCANQAVDRPPRHCTVYHHTTKQTLNRKHKRRREKQRENTKDNTRKTLKSQTQTPRGQENYKHDIPQPRNNNKWRRRPRQRHSGLRRQQNECQRQVWT